MILGRGHRPPDSGEALFNEITLHFPVRQRWNQEPIRLFTMDRTIPLDCFPSRIFRRLFEITPRFCPSPAFASSSSSYCSHHDFSLVCRLPFVIVSEFGGGRPKPPFHFTTLFEQQQSCESFARRTAPIPLRSRDGVLCATSCWTNRQQQMHSERTAEASSNGSPFC